MRISGHFNPAVTLSLLATRRIEAMMAALYIIAQVLGAVAAGYALKLAFSEATFSATRGGGLAIALDVTAGQAFLVEAIATFFLVFVVYGTAVDLRGPKIGGLAIGFVVAADILAIGPLTGASMNPARSFGPAVASGIYEAPAALLVCSHRGRSGSRPALRIPVHAPRSRAGGPWRAATLVIRPICAR